MLSKTPSTRETAGPFRHLRAHGIQKWNGLIPACAGTTGTMRSTTLSAPVHPRIREDHGVGNTYYNFANGSSPHARGPHRPDYPAPGPFRLIPACAGTTTVSATKGTAVSGSSPHARGPLRCAHHLQMQQRLIPACAGTTSPAVTGSRPTTAHPRMRGDHYRSQRANSIQCGSSPHARGPPQRRDRARVLIRLIPACAGTTHAAYRRGS